MTSEETCEAEMTWEVRGRQEPPRRWGFSDRGAKHTWSVNVLKSFSNVRRENFLDMFRKNL